MGRTYSHIISLGSFCSVAMELEKKGLRAASYPFDWVIGDDFESVIGLIDSHFEDFLEVSYLSREHRPDVYFNSRRHIHFYHDFNASDSLERQIPDVRRKYDRRIERFYDAIRQPTLFVRYCIRPKDEEFVRNNRESILKFLRSFNPDNAILYILSSDSDNRMILDESGCGECFIRQPENDFVRKWIDAVPGLAKYLYSVSTLRRSEIARNIFLCYKKKVIKKLRAL